MPRSAKIVPLPQPQAIEPDSAVNTAAVPIPLADLILSPLNPRQEHDPEGIAALAESLRSIGLIQNLAGYRDAEGRVAIVAGGRRLAALRLAAAERPDLDPVPVRLAPDEATARLWALAENTAREALHVADEVRAYRRMVEGGSPLPVIAAAFAVTEAHVRRRLKLASLPSLVLDALKAGRISVGHAQVLTLTADEARQVQALDLLVQRPMSEESLRRVLTQERVRADDRQAVFVGLPAYEAAGGTVTRDLFSAEDEAFVDDPALLDRLFEERLTTVAETKRAEGWRWVEPHRDHYLPWDAGKGMARVYPLPSPMTDEEEAELAGLYEMAEAEELSDEGYARIEEIEQARPAAFDEGHRAVAGGWVYVDRDGDLCEALGFIRAEDKADAIAAGAIQAPPTRTGGIGAAGPGEARKDGEGVEDGSASDDGTGSHAAAVETPAKPPYSAVLEADMRAVRLAAVQGALLDRPDLVLDLLAFSLSPESGWATTPLDVRAEAQPITPTEADGLSLDARLTERPAYTYGPDDLLAAFEAFRAQGQAHRDAMLAQAFARTLRYGGGATDRTRTLFERIEQEAGASLRSVWQPTGANFLGRVRSEVLDALFKDLLDRTDDDPAFRAFRAMKKGEKVAAMERLFADPEGQGEWLVTPEQRARIVAWAPPCA